MEIWKIKMKKVQIRRKNLENGEDRKHQNLGLDQISALI